MRHFDEIIRDKANNHNAEVPANAWNNIAPVKKERRFTIYWWALSILLCIGLIIENHYNDADLKKKDNLIQSKAQSQDLKVNRKYLKNEITEKSRIEKNQISIKKDKNYNSKSNNDNTIKNKDDSKLAKATIDPRNPSKQYTKNDKSHGNNAQSEVEATRLVAGNVITNKGKKKKVNKGKTNVQILNGEIDSANNKDNAEYDMREIVSTKPDVDRSYIVTNDTILKQITHFQVTEINNKSIVDSNTKQLLVKRTNKDNKKPLVRKSKEHIWFLDVGISPLLPIQHFDNAITFHRTQITTTGQNVFNGSLNKTSIDPSVAYSIAIKKQIGQKLQVGTGLQYLKLKENITISGKETSTKYEIIYRLINTNGPQLISDTMKITTEGNRQITATNSYQFLSLPVFFQYNLVHKHTLSIDLTGGFLLNVYNKYKNAINEQGISAITSSSTIQRNNKVSLSLFGGIKLATPLTKKIELFGMPAISLSAGNLRLKNSIIDKKISQVGVTIGLSMKMN